MNKNSKQSTPPKVNKALYAVTVALLFVVAVIIALMGSAGKKNGKVPGGDSLPPVSNEATDTLNTPDTYRPETDAEIPPVQEPAPDTEPPVESTKDDEDKSPVSAPAPALILPTSGILTKGHSMDIQVYSQTMGDYRVHCGIDISTAPGEAVVAAADGTVSAITNDPLYGVTVTVAHSGGLVTQYRNLEEDLAIGIEVGATVKGGEILGAVGDSAMAEVAEEPHLHFEVYSNGTAQDPLEYLDEAALVSLNINPESLT